MFKKLLKFLYIILGHFRMWLNKMRIKNPVLFDKIYKFFTFIFPFASTLIPALLSNNWFRVIIELILLSLMLINQWAVLTNRIIEKEDALKEKYQIEEDLNRSLKDKDEIISKLIKNEDDLTLLVDEDEKHYKKRIIEDNQLFDEFAGFSHKVSDTVKKTFIEIYNKSIDSMTQTKINTFLQESLSTLEDILSIYYKKTICASIKLSNNKNTVKTYARGKNNINSRGGSYICSIINKKPIKIDKNYAYLAIVRHGQTFFAESNLKNMKNRFNAEDVFFCERGDDYIKYFYSTIVMPIRIPVIYITDIEKHPITHEILGILCIDCIDEITDWSDVNFRENRAYHIIANYVDSLAMLIKEYRDAIKTKKTNLSKREQF